MNLKEPNHHHLGRLPLFVMFILYIDKSMTSIELMPSPSTFLPPLPVVKCFRAYEFLIQASSLLGQ